MHARARRFAFTCATAVLPLLAACGGGSTSAPPAGSATLSGTLAYVVSECREDSAGFFLHQALLVRRGERDPVTVMEPPDVGPVQLPIVGLCRGSLRARFGLNFSQLGAFQRLGVSADGSVVAFELSDQFSALGLTFLTPEERGLFVVNADGTGLRRLGPPSRQANFTSTVTITTSLGFSPDGRSLVVPDLGPGPNGEEAPQIVAVDLLAGKRTQLTQLPLASPAPDAFPDPGGICCPTFTDNRTVQFFTEANPDGLNPNGDEIIAAVNADGSGGLRLPPSAVVLPGSQIDTRFVITGGEPLALFLKVPGQPVNIIGSYQSIYEAFFFDGGQNLLQLTNFRRADTITFSGNAEQRVFFAASADPLGTNPSNNCQIFSIASLGGDLRQLTQFHEAERSKADCENYFPRPMGCSIGRIARDDLTDTLVFYSTCDPLGMNPNGGQLFSLGADGSGLRQLTDARGLVTEADGTSIAEFPGPYSYSRVRRAGL